MITVPNRPRGRPPNHPAELDIADKLDELHEAITARMECEGDDECRLSPAAVNNLVQAVRARRALVHMALGVPMA